MKFTTALLVLAATTLPAMAVPTAEPEPAPLPVELAEREPEAAPANLEKRDTNIYVCEGTCVPFPCFPLRPLTN